MERQKSVSAWRGRVLCLLLLHLTCPGGLCDEKTVYEEIIDAHHYNTKIRPVHNSSKTVDVVVGFELRQINNLDQQNQVLYTSGFVVAEWYDEYLAWDPAKFNGTDNLVLPPSTIWLPDFGMVNSADTFYHTSFTTDFRVHIKYTGHILWSFGGNFATTCELDLTFFPFDRQICNYTIENWAYSSDEVQLINRSSIVHLDDYHTNGEWELEHSSVHLDYIYHDIFPGKPFPKLTFNLYLKRKSGYYGLNIITPCFFIIAMSLTMFWLPADSGEKVSLGVTVLLAFSVFQLVIAESSPKTSDFFPILSLYVAFVMGMSAVSTTTAIICLYFHHHLPNRPVPRHVKILFFKYMSRILCMHDSVPDMAATNWITPMPSEKDQQVTKSQISLGVENLDVPNDDKKAISREERLRGWPPAEAEIVAHLRYITDRLKDRDHEITLEDEWKALARVIDRAFFYICLIVIGSVCLWMFTQQEAPKFTDSIAGGENNLEAHGSIQSSNAAGAGGH